MLMEDYKIVTYLENMFYWPTLCDK